MITTLIFDLDGLLADTEKLHRQAYQDTLGPLGVTISDRQYEDHWIRDGKGIAEFVSKYGLPVDPDIVRSRKSERYEVLVRSSVEAMPGAVDVLKALSPRKTLALATSSYRDAAYAVLHTLDIEKYFACIATRANVERMKPFPDVFLWVASALGVPPGQCLVLEDAEKGIVAADAAGMRSIAIPNVHTRNNDFSRATMVLPDLAAVTIDQIENLNRVYPA